MTILINFLLAIYVLDALLMLLVILMQRPKSEGLGAAFGGGVTENIFGAQTTNVLTKATAWLAGLFFLLTFALSILYAHRSLSSSSLRRELMKTQTTSAATSTGSPATGKPTTGPQKTSAPNQVSSQGSGPIETPGPPPSAAQQGTVPSRGAPLVPSAPPAGSKPPRP